MSTRTQYEADLAALKGSLARMSRLSADAVEDALEALCTADAEEAKGIIKGDTEVNRMERDIEHRCMTLLLRQQPVASDLRFISAAMKVVTDVERIGDHAADIAEIAADPGKVDAALDVLMVIKYLERIGDHAVNIAEWVEFLRTGRYHHEKMF